MTLPRKLKPNVKKSWVNQTIFNQDITQKIKTFGFGTVRSVNSIEPDPITGNVVIEIPADPYYVNDHFVLDGDNNMVWDGDLNPVYDIEI